MTDNKWHMWSIERLDPYICVLKDGNNWAHVLFEQHIYCKLKSNSWDNNIIRR